MWHPAAASFGPGELYAPPPSSLSLHHCSLFTFLSPTFLSSLHLAEPSFHSLSPSLPPSPSLHPRQLLLYSVRYSSSFAKDTQKAKLTQVEHLIAGYHDNLTHYLLLCFNNSTVSFSKTEHHTSHGMITFSISQKNGQYFLPFSIRTQIFEDKTGK